MVTYFLVASDKRNFDGQWIFHSIADARKAAYRYVSEDKIGIHIGKSVKSRTPGKIAARAVGMVYRLELAPNEYKIVWSADTNENIGPYKRSITYILHSDGSLGETLDPFRKVENNMKRIDRKINKSRRA